MIKANNPNLKSWIAIAKESDFPIQNLPFGIFSIKSQPGLISLRAGVAIGDYVLDLKALSEQGFFNELKIDSSVFDKKNLNDFIALGKPAWRSVRERISGILSAGNGELRDNDMARQLVLHTMESIQMHMPVKVCDYTDFYSSIEHATNVGSMFRDPRNALLPNWRHLPVAYHGRASSIMVSGTDFHRPKGQTKADDAEMPGFGATRLLDFELEMAFIIGKETQAGESISTADAEDSIFGMVLFNDWSARDIQKWEYVPLGPFLAKNFSSTISPWVVTLDALEPFRTKGYTQEPKVLPYLEYKGDKNIDINLEVLIQPENQMPTVVSKSNYKYMYWNMNQQLAHHTINGCKINIGDMMASGTISGPTPDSFGSMLELSWGGKNPIKLQDGTERKFINDHDTVIIKGYAEKNGIRIGFGEAKAKVLPALGV